MVQAMIDAARKIFEPDSCLDGHGGDDVRHGAPDIECPYQTVETETEPSYHLADASLREPAHQFHLSQPQMGVNDTQSGGEVLIALCFDEWDLMIVPENRHWLRHWRVPERQHGEPLFQRALRVRARIRQNQTAEQIGRGPISPQCHAPPFACSRPCYLGW